MKTTKNQCIEVSLYGERLHRLFLDIIKMELDTLSVSDVNSVQALMLINIGGNSVTIGELTSKGYYSGSNASYNVKKMLENGYIINTTSKRDRRSAYINLSAKGKELIKKLNTELVKYSEVFKQKQVGSNFLEKGIEHLKKIDNTWRDVLINYI